MVLFFFIRFFLSLELSWNASRSRLSSSPKLVFFFPSRLTFAEGSAFCVFTGGGTNITVLGFLWSFKFFYFSEKISTSSLWLLSSSSSEELLSDDGIYYVLPFLAVTFVVGGTFFTAFEAVIGAFETGLTYI